MALRNARAATFQIIYPENGWRTGDQIIGYAKDHLATEYIRRNPTAEPAAIEENARIFSVADAMEVLESEGLMTFTAGSKALVHADLGESAQQEQERRQEDARIRAALRLGGVWGGWNVQGSR